MKLSLVRLAQTPQATLGHIETPEHEVVCCTLELPWRNNEANKSCVPAGVYECKRDWHHPGDLAKRYIVWELQNVPGGRKDCQAHVANKPSQILGCIAVGESYGTMDGEPAVLHSQTAFDRFMDRTRDATTLTLEIKEAWCEDEVAA